MLTQKARILELLKSKTCVEFPEILNLKIGQYNARLYELRNDGHVINNEVIQFNKKRCSFYRYIGQTVKRPYISSS